MHTGIFTGFVVGGFPVASVLAGPGRLAVLWGRRLTRLLLLVVAGRIGFRLATTIAFSRRFAGSRFARWSGRESSRTETESAQVHGLEKEFIRSTELDQSNSEAKCWVAILTDTTCPVAKLTLIYFILSLSGYG